LLVRRLRWIAFTLAQAAGVALAAPNEIKVFTDELAGYREHTRALA